MLYNIVKDRVHNIGFWLKADADIFHLILADTDICTYFSYLIAENIKSLL